MSLEVWKAPRGVSSYSCGPDVVLFRETTGDLFLLNDTAAYIWRELTSGATPSAVCQAVVATTDAPPDRVASDVRVLLAELERWAKLATPSTEDVIVGARSGPNAPARCTASHFEGVYRLLDFTFKVRAQHRDELEMAAELFGHLSAKPPVSGAATVFDIVGEAQRKWRLMKDAELIGERGSLAGLSPLLHAEVLASAYDEADCFAALHAAVVVHNERAILMPAPSGSGKSTLTAGLIAAGYNYCTDDLAVLTFPPIRIRSAPVGLGLKSGSWTPLSSKLPLLAEQRPHRRSDGQQIRYFVPPTHQIAPCEESYSAALVLFPRYEADTELSCRRIRSGEALVRMAQAGYHSRLSSPVVAALTQWLGNLPAYELEYSDLDEAISVIQTIA